MYAKCFWCNPNKTSRQSMHKYDFKINFYEEVLFIIIIITNLIKCMYDIKIPKQRGRIAKYTYKFNTWS
jgi:hypothetical protein